MARERTMDSVVQDIRALTVQDPDGGERSLGSLWAEQPVVLVFPRHFG